MTAGGITARFQLTLGTPVTSCEVCPAWVFSRQASRGVRGGTRKSIANNRRSRFAIIYHDLENLTRLRRERELGT